MTDPPTAPSEGFQIAGDHLEIHDPKGCYHIPVGLFWLEDRDGYIAHVWAADEEQAMRIAGGKVIEKDGKRFAFYPTKVEPVMIE